MQCAVCKYKDNCKPRVDEPLLFGCTSGHPMEFINPPQKWVLCPICGGKTRTKIRPDTEAKNLIVFCPKCKRESVIDVEPRVYEENSLEERVSCGRTHSRGNWVKIMRNGFSVCLSSDGEKPFSQIRLKEMCLEILNKF